MTACLPALTSFTSLVGDGTARIVMAGPGPAFHFIGMGLAPFIAGLISPAFGMRPYFFLTIVAMAGGLALWLRGEKENADRPRYPGR